jgi:putative DNA methylase
MIRGGWTITGSWPIATERPGRLRSQESAALATSVHLVCRPRPDDAPVGDWTEVLRELPNRVGDWMERLQAEGIKGADLVFACIGPAMEIYSRYRRVEDAEGHEIPLGGDPTAAEPYQRGFLAYVWERVGRLALEEVLGTAEARARNGAAGALEEDSRLTALFLWTLQSTQNDANGARGKEEDDESEESEDEEDDDAKSKKKKAGYTLIYDVARRFAQPLGIHLEKWEGRIIETEKGLCACCRWRSEPSNCSGKPTLLPFRAGLKRMPKPAEIWALRLCRILGLPRKSNRAGSGGSRCSRLATAPTRPRRSKRLRSTACTPPCCSSAAARPTACVRC